MHCFTTVVQHYQSYGVQKSLTLARQNLVPHIVSALKLTRLTEIGVRLVCVTPLQSVLCLFFAFILYGLNYLCRLPLLTDTSRNQHGSNQRGLEISIAAPMQKRPIALVRSCSCCLLTALTAINGESSHRFVSFYSDDKASGTFCHK